MQLPGIQDPQRAKELIGRTAVLGVQPVARGPQAGTLEQPGPGVAGAARARPNAAGAGRYLVENAARS